MINQMRLSVVVVALGTFPSEGWRVSQLAILSLIHGIRAILFVTEQQKVFHQVSLSTWWAGESRALSRHALQVPRRHLHDAAYGNPQVCGS